MGKRNLNQPAKIAISLICLGLLAGCALRPPVYVSGGHLTAGQSAYDVTFYDLNLTVDPEQKEISGFVDIRLRPLDRPYRTLELDLISRLKVERVWINLQTATFIHKNNKLFIDIPANLSETEILTARVQYHGKPPIARRPPWDGGFSWKTDRLGNPWVGVSCQEQGAKIWWPCKDHPADEPDSVALHFTIPENLVCASNGILTGITPAKPGWHTYHWKTRYPINNYSVTVNIAAYTERHRTYHGAKDMDIVFYVLPEDSAGADSLLIQAEEMLCFYAKYFGEYPFIDEKFGLAQSSYWGMEHQTINSYGNHYVNTKLGYDFLMLHEMGHEWWGNYLTADDWGDFWLHEGTDIYAEAMFIEEKYGTAEYLKFFPKSARPRILNQKPVAAPAGSNSAEGYSIDIYYKGGWVLHMLRYLFGREVLYGALYDFVQGSKTRPHNHVTTADFIALIQSRGLEKLDWFFDRYLYQKDLPELVATKTVVGDSIRLRLRWETPGFKMPLEVRSALDNQKSTTRIPIGNEPIDVYFAPAAIIEIDPDGWLLFNYKSG